MTEAGWAGYAEPWPMPHRLGRGAGGGTLDRRFGSIVPSKFLLNRASPQPASA